MNKKWFTLRYICDRYDISTTALYIWVEKNKVERMKIGKGHLYTLNPEYEEVLKEFGVEKVTDLPEEVQFALKKGKMKRKRK